jgi:hypothetical protein
MSKLTPEDFRCNSTSRIAVHSLREKALGRFHFKPSNPGSRQPRAPGKLEQDTGFPLRAFRG